MQVVEVGAGAACCESPDRDGQQGIDLDGGFAGVRDARVALGLKVVVGRDDDAGLGHGRADLAGDRQEVAAVEGDHHAVLGGLTDGAGCGPALGDHDRTLLVGLAQHGVCAARGRALEKQLSAVGLDALEADQRAGAVAQRDEQLVAQHARALGLDQLALGVGVAGDHRGPCPHLSGPRGCRVALDFGLCLLGCHASLAFCNAALALLGIDGLAVLGGGFVAALFGQCDQGADGGAVGAAARLARFPNVAGIAWVVVGALLTPGVPGLEGWLAEFFFEDEGHLHPGLAFVYTAHIREHPLGCLKGNGVPLPCCFCVLHAWLC